MIIISYYNILLLFKLTNRYCLPFDTWTNLKNTPQKYNADDIFIHFFGLGETVNIYKTFLNETLISISVATSVLKTCQLIFIVWRTKFLLSSWNKTNFKRLFLGELQYHLLDFHHVSDIISSLIFSDVTWCCAILNTCWQGKFKKKLPMPKS